MKGRQHIMKAAIVYWSGTGNTEQMADIIAGTLKDKAEVTSFTAGEFTPDAAEQFDAIAFGCPAMGDEVLEESEFEPMFASCEGKLSGKPIALFGSYGWGDGAWMRSWEERCAADGAVFACDSVICNNAPDDIAKASLEALAAALCG